MQDKKKLEDLKTNRLMAHLSIGFITALALVIINGQMAQMSTIIKGVMMDKGFYISLFTALGIDAILLLLSAFYVIVTKMKKTDVSEKILTPSVCLIWTAFILLGLGSVYFFYQYAISVCYILLLSFCSIYLVKNVYGKDFYIMSYGLAVSIAGFYILNKIVGDKPFTALVPIGCILLLLICALAAWALFVARKNKGKFKEKQVFSKTTVYWPFFIYLGLNFVGIAAVLIFGSIAAYYSMFIMVGFTLAAAVYYTVKLMTN